MADRKYTKRDETLEPLLNLDGEIILLENGYWTKFEATKVELTQNVPHGIIYSLTLHDRNNTRILGFDNSHAIKSRKKKYGARKRTWDHKHKMEKVYRYEFESASQLLEDFWKAVDEIINT